MSAFRANDAKRRRMTTNISKHDRAASKRLLGGMP
jgi:hypothetical protein